MATLRRNRSLDVNQQRNAEIVEAVAEATRAVMERVHSLGRDYQHLPLWEQLDAMQIPAKMKLMDGLIPLIIGETQQPVRWGSLRRSRIKIEAAKLAEEFGADRSYVESMYRRYLVRYLD